MGFIYCRRFEFRIFGEEYLKFRHFLVPNSFVFVKVFVKEGWTNRETGKKSDPRMQFNSMQMLHDVMENQANKLTIQMPIEDVSEDKIVALKQLFKTHKGDKQVQFVVYEMEEKVKLTMPSRKQKVGITKELLADLEQEEVGYKLN